MLFQDRRDAGRRLAEALRRLSGPDVLVLALPRGGVPVGFEVAQALGAVLDVLIVRKIGVPGQRELAMGAVASGGAVVVNRDILRALHLGEEAVRSAAADARQEIERQERALRGERPPVDWHDRVVVLVDDGLATGATMRAAVQVVRSGQPRRTVVAVPVAPPSTCGELHAEADTVVCLETPEPFSSVGQWYVDFTQTSDEEVRECLRRADAARAAKA